MKMATPILFLAALFVAGCPGGGTMARMPVVGSAGTKYLPDAGALPGLEVRKPAVLYRQSRMQEYLGEAAALYINHGATKLVVADYAWGGEDRLLTAEAYEMESDVAASGLFHYFRGKRLRNQGRSVDVGAEALLDTAHENRNLYFYKNRFFVKLIYSGPEPVPDLVPLATRVAGGMPGTSERPQGYALLEVEGVDTSTARVSPGYTFNYNFLAPGIFAQAPGAGPIAEVFLIGHRDRGDADKAGREYRTFLEMNGLDYTIDRNSRGETIWWARDPGYGRVVATVHGDYLIGVLRPKTYEQGRAMLERLVDRVDGR